MAGEVTRENWPDKALAFMRASGRSNGEHPVIRREGGNLAAWLAWMAFLTELRIPHRAAEKRGEMTVPAEYPWDFSADADHLVDAAEQMVDDDRERRMTVDRPISPQRRAELSRLAQTQMRSARVPPRASFDVASLRRWPSAFDAAKARELPEGTPMLSADLRARMNLPTAGDVGEERR